jgi:hypothetical protein
MGIDGHAARPGDAVDGDGEVPGDAAWADDGEAGIVPSLAITV